MLRSWWLSVALSALESSPIRAAHFISDFTLRFALNCGLGVGVKKVLEGLGGAQIERNGTHSRPHNSKLI